MESPAKILVVDDEPINVDYLEQELEDLGYQVISAVNGKDAIEKAATEAPDLILLDVMMPNLDGFAVCRILKEMEDTQLIPVVMMTALDGKEDRIKGIEAGADDFLTKPVEERELLARIQTAVKMKRMVDRKLQRACTEEPTSPAPGPRKEKPKQPMLPPTVPDKVFCRNGEYWTLAYAGTVCHMKDMVGLHYIAYLLHYPHQQIHVLDLVSAYTGQLEGAPSRGTSQRHMHALTEANLQVQAGLGDAGELLDPRAKAAYQQRLEDLREELEEAQAFNDLGRIEKLQQEIDFITQELQSGIGLHKRRRRTASTAERARVNVTRAIKSTLRKLCVHHPDLGTYLTDTIKTGTNCSYRPALHIPTPWQF